MELVGINPVRLGNRTYWPGENRFFYPINFLIFIKFVLQFTPPRYENGVSERIRNDLSN